MLKNPTDRLSLASYAIHVISASSVVALTCRYPRIMAQITVVGLLIGFASITTVKHRIVPIFVAFGLTMAPAFWTIVTSIRAHAYLGIIAEVLPIVGAAWILKKPGWVPFAFCTVAAGMSLSCSASMYLNRFNNDFFLPEEMTKFATISAVFTSVSLVETLVGVLIAVATPVTKQPKKKKRKIAIPSPE